MLNLIAFLFKSSALLKSLHFILSFSRNIQNDNALCSSVYSILLFYSFDRVNVTSGEIEDRVMMTGMHTVADIVCVCCGSIVGWKYVSME
uniref:Protein yippee n=1 Tax=Solanum tuberosum TaxID=4113 RepID=M1C4W7_SOLTU